jgi:hypothetical protein
MITRFCSWAKKKNMKEEFETLQQAKSAKRYDLIVTRTLSLQVFPMLLESDALPLRHEAR